MTLLVHELPAVVLTVNVEQICAKLTQLRNGHGNAAHTAAASAVCADPALYYYFAVTLDIVILKPLVCSVGLKDRRNDALVRSGTDKLPACPCTEDGSEGVNDY